MQVTDVVFVDNNITCVQGDNCVALNSGIIFRLGDTLQVVVPKAELVLS